MKKQYIAPTIWIEKISSYSILAASLGDDGKTIQTPSASSDIPMGDADGAAIKKFDIWEDD